MGNIQAATKPPTVSSVPSPPIPGSTPPPPIQSLAPILSPVVIANPGTYEDLHKNFKDMLPQVFEGGKVVISKGLSSHFQISHTVALSAFQPSSYRFGCTYVGSQQYSSPQEAFPVLLGDTDVSGNVNTNIILALSESTRMKCVAQMQNNRCVACQCTADYRASDFTASVTAGNIDVVSGSGVLVGQYLQQVTPRLSLGAELMGQYGPQIPCGQMSMLSFGGRYVGSNWQASATVSPLAPVLHACYIQKINDTMSVAAELETNWIVRESTAIVAYQIEIPAAHATFKAQLDTNWCIGATMEKKLLPFPFTFVLSGYAIHSKSQYRFGVGLLVG